MIHHSHPQYDIHFFGKDLSRADLEKSFTNLCFLKQVHGSEIVKADFNEPIADGHWTENKKKSLVIQTADCLPVMIYLPKQRLSLAIHAGWRGVEQKIVSKSLSQLPVDKFDPIHLYIGPHIQQKSFETDKDVAVSLLKAHNVSLESLFCTEQDNKFYIDLAALVVREVEMLKLQIDVLNVTKIDTKTNDHYYSYRAGDRGGRNYSVISLKP